MQSLTLPKNLFCCAIANIILRGDAETRLWNSAKPHSGCLAKD